MQNYYENLLVNFVNNNKITYNQKIELSDGVVFMLYDYNSISRIGRCLSENSAPTDNSITINKDLVDDLLINGHVYLFTNVTKKIKCNLINIFCYLFDLDYSLIYANEIIIQFIQIILLAHEQLVIPNIKVVSMSELTNVHNNNFMFAYGIINADFFKDIFINMIALIIYSNSTEVDYYPYLNNNIIVIVKTQAKNIAVIAKDNNLLYLFDNHKNRILVDDYYYEIDLAKNAYDISKIFSQVPLQYFCEKLPKVAQD